MDNGALQSTTNEEQQLYTPLAETGFQIRLLTIQPGQTETLDCSLAVFELLGHDTPEYETISYIWGDASHRESITINGHQKLVPASSYRVLRRVRLPKEPRLVWIDAVCINQQDIQERERQVAIMGQIFQNGVRNLIYWCAEHEHVEPAVRAIRRLHAEINDPDDQLNEDPALTHSGLSILDPGIISTEDWLALGSFLHADWIGRVWTLQEAVLAKSNMCFCGPFEIDLIHITNVCGWLAHISNPALSGLDRAAAYGAAKLTRLGAVLNRWRERGFQPYVLHEVRNRHCLLSVDRIYGVLGLFEGCSIVPNYSCNLAQLLEDMAIWLVTVSNLAVLSFVHPPQSLDDQIMSELPSWVPDWTDEYDGSRHASSLPWCFCADRGRASKISAFRNGDERVVLSASGIIISLVSVTAPLEQAPNFCGVQEEADQIFRNTLKHNENSESDPDVAIAMTLCCGVNEQIRRVGPEVLSHHKLMLDQGSRVLMEESLLMSHGGEIVNAISYCGIRALVCRNRKAFCTSNGYIGMAPMSVSVGDVVAVLYGYQAPLILRPHRDYYLFLGGAYVHGIMDGEAVIQHEETGGIDTVFQIC